MCLRLPEQYSQKSEQYSKNIEISDADVVFNKDPNLDILPCSFSSVPLFTINARPTGMWLRQSNLLVLIDSLFRKTLVNLDNSLLTTK